jgi:hypothetical protein
MDIKLPWPASLGAAAFLLVPCAALLSPVAAHAEAPGSLIKGPSPAVYYLGADGKRHAFPNERVFKTWFADFSGIVVVSDAELAAMPLGQNVTYKPGARLVKITTDPKVYAVAESGELRWITSESLATELYGSDWKHLVEDIPDAFFFDYRPGLQIAESTDYGPADELAKADAVGPAAVAALGVGTDAVPVSTVDAAAEDDVAPEMPLLIGLNTLIQGSQSTDLFLYMWDHRRLAFGDVAEGESPVNGEVHRSWYGTESSVEVYSEKSVSALPIAGFVTLRPGTLVAMPDCAETFVITHGGVIRNITDTQAARMYGSGWRNAVVSLSDDVAARHHKGGPITAAEMDGVNDWRDVTQEFELWRDIQDGSQSTQLRDVSQFRCTKPTPVTAADYNAQSVVPVIDCDAEFSDHAAWSQQGWSIIPDKQFRRIVGNLVWDLDTIRLVTFVNLTVADLRSRLGGYGALPAAAMDYLLLHEDLIPDDWRYAGHVVFWGTVYGSAAETIHVPMMSWVKKPDGQYGWVEDSLTLKPGDAVSSDYSAVVMSE